MPPTLSPAPTEPAPDSDPGAAAAGRIAWHCTCFNVRRASRAVSQIYDAALQPCGLRINQFSLLGAVETTGPTTVGDLALLLEIDRTTLTRNLKTIEDMGLIEISRGRDRRERRVTATPDGLAVMARAAPLWRAAQDRIIAGLGSARWRRMIDDLDALAMLDAT
jgi:DNA-binding MarR family transcriptional regulator